VPIYEYRCRKCGEAFEAFQKITDKPLTKCRFCDGKVEQLISHSNFQLKGAGWYLTDYARKSRSSSEPSTGHSTKSEASSDSKTKKKED
jgi:putative FmdB family regulatory protein